jgi:hypothetical protein
VAFNPLEPSGNYVSPALKIKKSALFICVFHMILTVNSDYFSQNSINKLIFAMVKCGVFFAVRTGFLNIVLVRFGFKGLIKHRTQ